MPASGASQIIEGPTCRSGFGKAMGMDQHLSWLLKAAHLWFSARYLLLADTCEGCGPDPAYLWKSLNRSNLLGDEIRTVNDKKAHLR